MNPKLRQLLKRSAVLSSTLIGLALIMQVLSGSASMAWMGDPNTGGIPIVSYHSHVELLLLGNANIFPMLAVLATVAALACVVGFVLKVRDAAATDIALIALWRTCLVVTACAAAFSVAATTGRGTIGITALGVANSAALLAAVFLEIYVLYRASAAFNQLAPPPM